MVGAANPKKRARVEDAFVDAKVKVIDGECVFYYLLKAGRNAAPHPQVLCVRLFHR